MLIASLVTRVLICAGMADGGQAVSGASADIAAETRSLASLRIEGQGIEQLVLLDEKGRNWPFEPPGLTVALPPGDYRLHRIRLSGGHSSESDLISASLRVAVDPNATATLKVGAPLRQRVQVERQGPILVVNYELIGQGGEQYAVSQAQGSPRPALAVYRGDSKVASGDFEFG